VGLLDDERLAVALLDGIALKVELGLDDLHHGIVHREYRGGALLLFALLRDQSV
jgi:hypothetical protein